MVNAAEIRDLAFTYKDQTVNRFLDGVSLDIAKGECLLILAPSVAGKSTFANCLNGIIPNMVRDKYEGIVMLNGMEVPKHAISHIARDASLFFKALETNCVAL